ncbi:MAG: hypothetical protein ABIA78_03605 [archaeon]
MREDILGALQSASIRGETLKKAMMSAYNAGYKKEDIEEAAAAWQQINSQKPVAQTISPQLAQKTIQSDFEKPSSKIKIILVIFALIILLGTLVGIFLFKAELISLFNSTFN